MNKDAFKEELKVANKQINKDYINDVVQSVIDFSSKNDKLGTSKNLIIAIEECTELAKEVTKQLRGKGDYYNLLEELADVYLGALYIRKICGIDDEDLAQAINIKVDKGKKAISETGK